MPNIFYPRNYRDLIKANPELVPRFSILDYISAQPSDSATAEAAKTFGLAITPPAPPLIQITKTVYPGKTGALLDLNSEPAPIDQTLYFHVNPKQNPEDYLSELRGTLDKIQSLNPSFLAVRLGFDWFFTDPNSKYSIRDPAIFKAIAEQIRKKFSNSFVVLGNGTSEDLPFLLLNFLDGYFNLTSDFFKQNPKKIIHTFEKKSGASYQLTPFGEILETISTVKPISSFDKKPGKEYKIHKNTVLEFKKIPITEDQFYRWKNSGLLNDLYRKGYEFDVIEDQSNLDLESLENQRLLSVEEDGDTLTLNFERNKLVLKKNSFVDAYTLKLLKKPKL